MWKVARNRVEKAMQYQYRDRRQKKRNMRALWIQATQPPSEAEVCSTRILKRSLFLSLQRINAAVRQDEGEDSVTYSQFVHGLAQVSRSEN